MRGSYFTILLVMLLMLSTFQLAAAVDSSDIVEDALKNDVVVILYFWDSECADCPIATEIIDDIEDSYGASVQVISLNLDYGEGALVDLYDIEILPTIVIYDELDRYLSDEPFIIIEGLKTLIFYSNKVDDALQYDDVMKSSADTFFNNAQQFYNLSEYSKSKYNFEKAMELYDELGDVSNYLTCSQWIIKCDKYVNADSNLAEADDYFADESYILAKESYLDALDDYEYLSDEEMISYCNSQILKCELYPSVQSDYDDVLLLMSAGDYNSALSILNGLRADYQTLDETDMVSEVDNLIDKCNDYILANGFYDEGTTSLNSQNYDMAITKYQSAKEIYESYSDSEKVALCDQNIAIAQQFINSQTPAPTTPPPEDNLFYINKDYLPYAGGAIALILLFSIIGIYSRSRRKNNRPSPRPKNVSTAIEKASNQFKGVEDSSIDTSVSDIQEETTSTTEQQAVDGFIDFQDKAIQSKNSLLVNYLQWADEFYDELDSVDPKEYFIYRERFDELYAFFTRSFSSDETYLDQELIDIAKSRLQHIQSKLNDLMDVM